MNDSTKDTDSKRSEPKHINPAWIEFFKESRKAAELVRQRRAAKLKNDGESGAGSADTASLNSNAD